MNLLWAIVIVCHAGKSMPTDGGDADAATSFVESWSDPMAIIDTPSAALRA